ncbi:MAG: nuclear transport factor 2 family protein [Chitinophagaceae bacterium]|nr:nuclear transport factor 2 family protein [Chitinophagaceae bacterium]MBL0056914.1 nuclear transport factor 2 family protein [Chitinophagaceae bacterium]
MKRRFIKCVLLTLVIFGASVSAGFSQSKDEQKILAVMRLEEEYWSRGDIDAYVSLYAPEDSVRMILSKGAAYGRDNILAFYKKYWPKEKMGKLILDGEQMERISSRFYFVTGYFHVIYPDGKKIEGRYSSLMKKIKGKWYIYTDHSG